VKSAPAPADLHAATSGGARVVQIFGASSAVGQSLLPLLRATGCALVASSRTPPDPLLRAGLRWRRECLPDAAPPDPATTHVLSLGPLDLFTGWLCRLSPGGALRQVVALGSTSVRTKQASAAIGERELARRLLDAEARLAHECARLGARWTLLRPTLIYGGEHGLVARIGAVAARWHVYPRPLGRIGRALRQPVHVQDLARVVYAALDNAGALDRAFELGGGEVLALAALCRRAAVAGTRVALPLPLPTGWLLHIADTLRLLPASAAMSRDSLARMAQDQLCDNTPAAAALRHAPRGFDPGRR